MSASVSRPQITAKISDLVKKHIDPNNDPRIYWAKEVTFDYASEHSIRVDFMRYKPANNSVSGIEKGDFYCYEVKSSEEDFHSKNGHNFIGDFNYYVMPEDVYENVKKLIPWDVGVYVPDDSSLHCVKKAIAARSRSAELMIRKHMSLIYIRCMPLSNRRADVLLYLIRPLKFQWKLSMQFDVISIRRKSR